MQSENFNLSILKQAGELREAKAAPKSVNQFVDDVSTNARKDLTTPVEIIEAATFPKLRELYVDARKWHRIKNVVAVSADLKNSTSLSFGKYVNTSARLYEASTGSAVRIFSRFDPEFIDIQGDGLFGLFHGELAFERAFCAAVTLKTFSERSLERMIDEVFSDTFPDTGFKIGMASGTLAVKKVGVRGTNEPVWAGKPVNWAAKCAQKADRHQLIVTSAVWDKLSKNDYIAYSCGCPDGTPKQLWKEIEVEKLDKHGLCRLLLSNWCETHGDEFCQAILNGETERDDVADPLAA
jgi:class 3 adenylate cyclase